MNTTTESTGEFHSNEDHYISGEHRIYTHRSKQAAITELSKIYLHKTLDCRVGDNKEFKLLTLPSLSGDPLCRTKQRNEMGVSNIK